MKAHLIQLDIAWENPIANFNAVRQLVRQAPVEPGDLLVLPEMFDSGFSFTISRTQDLGPTRTFLQDLAQSTRCTVHGHRTVLAPDGHGRNRATIISPAGTVLAEYDKIHLFSVGGETQRLAPGSDLTSYQWGSLNICPAICYDLRFPELFRAAVLRGSDTFVLGSCWPAARQHHRRMLTIARAIENQAFVMVCNRCGSDPAPTNLAYDGHSMIVDPMGNVLAEADGSACVLSAEIDATAVTSWRTKFPALRDIRFAVPPRPGT